MAIDLIDVHIEITLGKEGKYSNNPNDSGGETMWGITKTVAVKQGYSGQMIRLPREEAKRIYRQEYYIDPKFDQVLVQSPSIAKELFDSGVNCGTGTACRWLQQSLNRLNRGGRDYKDLKVDGSIGPVTLGALRSYLGLRGSQGELVLLRMLNVEQGHHYNKLADTREKDQEFIFGWFLNRVVI